MKKTGKTWKWSERWHPRGRAEEKGAWSGRRRRAEVREGVKSLTPVRVKGERRASSVWGVRQPEVHVTQGQLREKGAGHLGVQRRPVWLE